MKKFFKYLLFYIKYHEAVNDFYKFSLKSKYGEQIPDDLNWLARTKWYYYAE